MRPPPSVSPRMSKERQGHSGARQWYITYAEGSYSSSVCVCVARDDAGMGPEREGMVLQGEPTAHARPGQAIDMPTTSSTHKAHQTH